MYGNALNPFLCPLPGFIWKSDLKGSRSIFSMAWSQYTGFKCKSLTDDWLCFVHPNDKGTILEVYEDSCSSGLPFRFEYRVRDKNGDYRWFLDCGNPCKDKSGSLIGFAGMSIDIHDLKMESIQDKLTGLSNFAFYEAYLEKQVNKRGQTKTALIVADVNGLKTVNDTLGHECGNELIVAASDILRKAFRSEDAVCRIGGDEFAIILVDIEEADISQVEKYLENKCLNIKTSIDEYNQTSGQPFILDIALGFSVYQNQGLPMLKQTADAAMYKDKKKSKQRGLA
jgi:diguanylate cyclase (GGDEF)-like protein/PAS domain S-box-containing protein